MDGGCSMRVVKAGLGHSLKERPRGGSPSFYSDVRTTTVYIYVLNRYPAGVRSPLDEF